MTDQTSDAELVAQVAAGSSAALETLYRRHAAWLTVRLSRRCADPALVDEVLQDTFVSVWRGAGSYRGTGDPGAWIWGIAVRRLVDAFRRRPPVAAPILETDLDLVESAEDRVLVGVEHGDLAGALDRLSPELRAVVQATVLDGLTTREAAQLLGLRPGTVKTRMMRARQVLRKELA
ncbi:MAG: RNA polymerase sigma factor [Nocardioidaceae bacterium]|nr:RNA polymerase sigma factor [Nocardioidaceae bacterium]